MAERKDSPQRVEATKAKAAAQPSRAAAKPKRRLIRAGGHVIEADPVPETPPEVINCSVCGGVADKCGHADSGGGWGIEG